MATSQEKVIQGAEREAAQARALKEASAGDPRLAGQLSALVKLVKVHLDETPGLEANNHPRADASSDAVSSAAIERERCCCSFQSRVLSGEPQDGL